MRSFTDFLVKTRGSGEIDFRHTARTVDEFLSLEGEFIYDIYGLQCIKKSEITFISESLAPFALGHLKKFHCAHGGRYNLLSWVGTLSSEEIEEMKNDYYMYRETHKP